MQDFSLTDRVLKSKSDKNECDRFIDDYKPFILSHTAKVTKQPYVDESSEYFNRSLFAFYEAILNYDPEKGGFLNYARFVIEKRLIDHIRKVMKDKEKYATTYVSDDGEIDMSDSYFNEKSIDEYESQEANRNLSEEIQEFIQELEFFGDITMENVYADCPKNKSTRQNAKEIVNYILNDEGIVNHIINKKYLPLKIIALKYNINYKKLTKIRRYIIACVLIALGDYPYLQEYVSANIKIN